MKISNQYFIHNHEYDWRIKLQLREDVEGEERGGKYNQ